MTVKKMLYLALAATVVAVAYIGWTLTSRGAYEAAEYTVIKADGPFEVREYPDLMLATTQMKLRSQGEDGSFMRLFGYITGDNDLERKVAMTVPVFMEPDGSETQGQMGFVIPKKVIEERIPEPSNASVHIRKRLGGRFAVLRFAGRMNNETVKKAEDRLRTWIDKQGLNGKGQAETAGYDPPWTPGPFRRNEVLVRLSESP